MAGSAVLAGQCLRHAPEHVAPQRGVVQAIWWSMRTAGGAVCCLRCAVQAAKLAEKEAKKAKAAAKAAAQAAGAAATPVNEKKAKAKQEAEAKKVGCSCWLTDLRVLLLPPPVRPGRGSCGS